MHKKLLSLAVAICVTLGCGATAFADNQPSFSKDNGEITVVKNGIDKFTDISESTHSWAVEAVSAMTEKGIINGVSETAFSPDTQVTRIQSLLLISRMLGYNDDTVQTYINTIYSLYENELSSLSTPYKKELAFLVFSGAFTADEITSMNLDEAVSREEAAMFLSKADKMQSNTSANSVKYGDDSSISQTYKNYVYYVSKKGYMNGLGDNMFGPKEIVTRAQIATMLYRVMNNSNISYEKVTVDKVNLSDNTVSVFSEGATVKLGSDVTYRNKGKKVDIKEYYTNLYCVATKIDSVIVQLDAFFEAQSVETSTDGKILYLPSTKTGVQIADIDTGEEITYKWADRYSITIKGSEGTIDQLRKGDYVVLGLDKAGRIIELEVMEITSELTDLVISEVEVTASKTYIYVEDEAGETQKYEITSSAKIRKNGTEVAFDALGEGDKISKLSLSYNRVKSLDVYSDISSTNGKITTIHLSADGSYIVISNGSEESKFNLNKNTKYYVYGEEKTVYGLELEQYASITLDGSNVAKVEVSTVSSTATNIMGTVLAVNTTANIISVQTVDGTVAVYISTKATAPTKIVDNNGTSSTATTRALKDIKAGATITAIGTSEAGYFTASTIVYSNN